MYICPAGQGLKYRTTDRKGYQQYASDPEQCKSCPFLNHCT
ncbi:transposase, partial [Paenibacillus typhae]